MLVACAKRVRRFDGAHVEAPEAIHYSCKLCSERSRQQTQAAAHRGGGGVGAGAGSAAAAGASPVDPHGFFATPAVTAAARLRMQASWAAAAAAAAAAAVSLAAVIPATQEAPAAAAADPAAAAVQRPATEKEEAMLRDLEDALLPQDMVRLLTGMAD